MSSVVQIFKSRSHLYTDLVAGTSQLLVRRMMNKKNSKMVSLITKRSLVLHLQAVMGVPETYLRLTENRALKITFDIHNI